LGGIFVYASYEKILHPVPFTEIVYNYHILPGVLLNLVALFLPWLELLIGLSLILGVWLHGAVLVCNALLVIFFTTLLFNIFRGLDIDCGCFTVSAGPSSGGHMFWYLLRDSFFLVAAGFLLIFLFFSKTQIGVRFDKPWKVPSRQALALLMSTALLAWAANQIRPDSLPLLGDWSPEARIKMRFGENILIPFEEARVKFLTGSAVFLDARPPDLFLKGHIQGARNLPLAEFDRMAGEVFMDFPEDTLFVTYCDGEDCVLSAELALKLKGIGFKNVRVLQNGWSMWKSHQLPTKAGEELAN
jgi:rhodanese-related sulfurtransferase